MLQSMRNQLTKNQHEHTPGVEAPIFIDVEASGFGSYSSPVEVGLAINHTDRFCMLVLPEPDWQHWTVDYPWLRKLFYAGKQEMLFRVSALEMLLSEDELLRWDATKSIVSSREVGDRHRASVDAHIVRETYLGVKGAIQTP